MLLCFKERLQIGDISARFGGKGALLIDFKVTLVHFKRFFALLGRYKSGDASLVRPTFGYIPGWSRLTMALEPDAVEIRVQDNGRGIRPEMLPQVFGLFVQSDRTLDMAQGGLGVGLTLVKRLVELHGGSVAARSEGEGTGSEFI